MTMNYFLHMTGRILYSSSGGSLLTGNTADAFAADLCVASGDVNSAALTLNAYSAGLFDVNHERTVYAKDIFTKRSPASITKVMTALVALKYGNLDELVTVTSTAADIEYGSSVCDIKEGEASFPAAAALWYDARFRKNDAAMMIAEHVGGSVDHFVEMTE